MKNSSADGNRIDVLNFGCRLNAYESEVIKETLAGVASESITVFNTCAVTQEAERQSRQKIRQIKKKNPNAKIVVTGCAAQVNPLSFSSMPEVDLVFGNTRKTDKAFLLDIPKMINDAASDSSKRSITGNIMEEKTQEKKNPITHFEDRTRAFTQIQNGCDHRCSFCIIPYGRGNSRSVPEREILREIQNLLESGYKEVVLTGVDLTSYGKDLGGDTSLGKLSKSILRHFPELPRLRVSSIDVAEVDNDLIDVISNNPRMMPYLHLSLQSGDDVILKLMKRRHTRQMALDFCKKIKSLRNDIALGSDIITGFPSETPEMFMNTSKLLAEADLVFNHIFTFSPRSGTLAAIMKNQIPKEVKKERTRILTQQTKEQRLSLMRNIINSTQKGLIESDMTARLENFLPVKLIEDSMESFQKKQLEGQIQDIRILEIRDGALIGALV